MSQNPRPENDMLCSMFIEIATYFVQDKHMLIHEKMFQL